MRNTFIPLTVAFLCCGLNIAYAQTDETDSLPPTSSLFDSQVQRLADSQKLVWLDGKPTAEAAQKSDLDSVRRLVYEFYYDQFRNTQDPHMPYFLFISKGSELMLGVGGGVRMRAFYDWNGAMPTNAFAPSMIRIPADKATRERFNATPSGTYINLRLIGHNSRIGDYGLYIEADFTGANGRDLTVKKAYAMIHDFTVGYATTTFSDVAAQPAVADAAGVNNKFSNSTVLVRYMPCFRKKWYVAVSVETPQTAIDVTGPQVSAASNKLPDAAAFLQYEWAHGQHVRLSGIVRSLSYMSVAESKRHNLAGWGVQLSAVAHPEMHLTTYGTINCGKGYAGLGGDLFYGNYDLVPNPHDTAELYAPFSLGWNVGLQYNFRPELFSTIAVSQTHYSPKSGTMSSEYKSGTFACANVFWSILPRLTVAAEYDWGLRRNISGLHKAASRANLSCMFTF